MPVELLLPNEFISVGSGKDLSINEKYFLDKCSYWPLDYEIVEWMEENIKENINIFRWPAPENRYDFIIRFSNENEAILFKMRWL